MENPPLPSRSADALASPTQFAISKLARAESLTRIIVMRAIILFTILLSPFVATAAEDLREPRARDHRRVMYFVDDAGHERPVKSRTDWERRRRDVITGVEAAMGRLPDRSGLGPVRFDVVPGSRSETDKITREELRIGVG